MHRSTKRYFIYFTEADECKLIGIGLDISKASESDDKNDLMVLHDVELTDEQIQRMTKYWGDIFWGPEEVPKYEATLVFVFNDIKTHFLGIFQKDGLNALGGKLKETELWTSCAVREVREETDGVVLLNRKHLRHFANLVGDNWEVRCYMIRDREGNYFPGTDKKTVIARTDEGEVMAIPVGSVFEADDKYLKHENLKALLAVATTMGGDLDAPVVFQHSS